MSIYGKVKLRGDSDKAARDNWNIFQAAYDAGHEEFIKRARRLDDLYLGGGKQWTDEDRKLMRFKDRPVYEFNHIQPAIHTALGIQLNSRVDIALKPRGYGADEITADILSRIILQVCDENEFHWLESRVYEDGLIQRRGYYDIRISLDKNIDGDIIIENLDPLDVIPDPDSSSYDPKGWRYVIVMRWLTFDEISLLYGEKIAKRIQGTAEVYIEDGSWAFKGRFGAENVGDSTPGDGTVYYNYGWFEDDQFNQRRYLVLDRQHRKVSKQDVVVSIFGDIHPLDSLSEGQIRNICEQGGCITRRYVDRVRWTVSSGPVLIHDDWSPYRSFTVVPYFPIFRRGRTRGMVDGLESPQELENKALTSFIEILNSASNPVWKVPEGSLVNMTTESLAKNGAKAGLVVEFDPSIGEPTREKPLAPPQAAADLISRAEFAIKTISGMSDALQGQPSNEVSGVAIKSKQYQGQLQMGRHLDNLAYTRRLAAKKILELIQDFYTTERLIRIYDPTTRELKDQFVINQIAPDGRILNDVTIGEYDVIVSDTPTHASYMDAEYDKMMGMRTQGIPVPDKFIVESSNVRKKYEIMKEMEAMGKNPLAEAEAKVKEAEAMLKAAQAKKHEAEMVEQTVKAQYEAIQTAAVIAQTPAVAPLADTLLKSAGFKDKDQPPIIPGADMASRGTPAPGPTEIPAGAPGVESNTSPAFPPVPQAPPSPEQGAGIGIETQETADNLPPQ